MEGTVDPLLVTATPLSPEEEAKVKASSIWFRKMFPKVNPLTTEYLHTVKFPITKDLGRQLRDKMAAVESLPIGKVKGLIVATMKAYNFPPNMIRAVFEDMNDENIDEYSISKILVSLWMRTRGLADVIDRAVEENKTTPYYFMGVEEKVHFELYENKQIESINGAFITYGQSVIRRLMIIMERDIADHVSADSSYITKYYALITLANVGEAMCWLVGDEDSIEHGGGKGETWTMLDEIWHSNIPIELIIRMWDIFESLTEDEIERLTEEEDGPPNCPQSMTFSTKLNNFMLCFEEKYPIIRSMVDNLMFAFDDGKSIYDFSDSFHQIRERIDKEVARHDHTVNLPAEGALQVDETNERINRQIFIDMLDAFLNIKLGSQVHRKSRWGTRRNALEMLVLIGFHILFAREQRPKCVVLWDRRLAAILTDRMHKILSRIGESEEMRQEFKWDLLLQKLIVDLYHVGHAHFPGMKGVMRLFVMVDTQGN